MHVLKSLAIAFSMYSRIPMPQFDWKKEDMRYVMVFFPLVGLAVGAVELLWNWLVFLVGIPAAAAALIALIIPLLVTGGIHLDGFMDTSDALRSYGAPEKKWQILKDPHIGAFAVLSLTQLLCITLVAWICLYKMEAFCEAFGRRGSGPDRWALTSAMLMLFFLARVLSGLSVLSFPKMGQEGTVSGFAGASEKRCFGILITEMFLGVAFLLVCVGWRGVLVLAGMLVVFGIYHYMAIKQFGGINGDLAGWFVSIAECTGLVMLAIGWRIG